MDFEETLHVIDELEFGEDTQGNPGLSRSPLVDVAPELSQADILRQGPSQTGFTILLAFSFSYFP